ncbi:hypothetical protein IFT68_16105 [Oxalobacteraceae sp. CFBP 13730]|nr:hypothetical protein [Oxalobacteraceae sp. CFBP 13730]
MSRSFDHPNQATIKGNKMALKIITAFYGDATRGADVTAQVQAIVANGNDDVSISNQSLGGDPDIGTRKQFGAVYFHENGTIASIVGQEGDTLDFVK